MLSQLLLNPFLVVTEMRLRECFAAVDRGEVGVWVRVPVDFPLTGAETLCDTEARLRFGFVWEGGRQLIRRKKKKIDYVRKNNAGISIPINISRKSGWAIIGLGQLDETIK